MTANVMASDREACIAAGMDDHIGKPIDIFTLINVILKHCTPADGAAPVVALAVAAGTTPATVGAAASGAAIEVEQALARMGGNKELFVALASTYVPEATQFVAQLRAALALPGYEGAANILHTFKSAAGIVGAAQLHDYASGLESLLRKGEPIDPGAALKAVQLLVDASVADLAPAVASVAEAIQEVAPAKGTPAGSLADALEELDALLNAHNMAAFDAYAALERGAGQTLGTRLDVLHNSIQVMDFKTASSECRKLLRECA
jgi:HPt (histidine-containing phosphotransfer) domain-containing protein